MYNTPPNLRIFPSDCNVLQNSIIAGQSWHHKSPVPALYSIFPAIAGTDLIFTKHQNQVCWVADWLTGWLGDIDQGE